MSKVLVLCTNRPDVFKRAHFLAEGGQRKWQLGLHGKYAVLEIAVNARAHPHNADNDDESSPAEDADMTICDALAHLSTDDRIALCLSIIGAPACHALPMLNAMPPHERASFMSKVFEKHFYVDESGIGMRSLDVRFDAWIQDHKLRARFNGEFCCASIVEAQSPTP